MTKSQKATIAKVQIGMWVVDGLMLPDGTYAIAVSQLAEIFQFDKNQASRDIKSLLGEGFQFDKCRSELHPKAVNILTIENASKVALELTIQGNPTAQAFMRATAEEALQRRFDIVFGREVTEEGRNVKLAQRMARLKARHHYTDTIKAWQEWQGRYPDRDEFRRLTVKVNRALFGCDHFKCDRDNMTPLQQELITRFEKHFYYLFSQHPDPANFPLEDELTRCIDFFGGKSQ